MFRNRFFYQEIPLGSKISLQDDCFKALAEGRSKAAEIAKALAVKIPDVTAGDIEIHCAQYDPQLDLEPTWFKVKLDTMTLVPKAPTLKTLRV